MRDLVVLFIHFIATPVAVGELASPLPVTLLANNLYVTLGVTYLAGSGIDLRKIPFTVEVRLSICPSD
jgi:hypothetical protein